MILVFKDEFIPQIIDGIKIHTIRTDIADRWGNGALINFSGVGYKEFMRKECVSTQAIEIYWRFEGGEAIPKILIDKREITKEELSVLAINDGFSSVEDFLSWDAWDKKYYSGKLIHWTEKRY